eukprot:2975631-Rhodomonas_salina.1
MRGNGKGVRSTANACGQRLMRVVNGEWMRSRANGWGASADMWRVSARKGWGVRESECGLRGGLALNRRRRDGK